MLSKETMTFTHILKEFEIESSHLTYHLESLGDLISKTEDGRYKLSNFGRAAIAMMSSVEDAPKAKPKLPTSTLQWKAVLVVLIFGTAVLAGAYYNQYQELSGLSTNYKKLSTDLTKTMADYDKTLADYNESLETYVELQAEYNRALEILGLYRMIYQKIPANVTTFPPSDLPAYLWVTRSSLWLGGSFSNLTDLDLVFFTELRDAINRLEMVYNETGLMEPGMYVGTANMTNVRGSLLVGFLGAHLFHAFKHTYNVFSANGTFLREESSWHYEYISYVGYQEKYYYVNIFFDKIPPLML